MKPALLHHRQSGSALISTLLVILVLSIIVVAFLQSMSTERQTARSYMNKYRAELAAQAAASDGENLLARLFKTYPDSCTAWTTFPNTRGTTYFYRVIKGTEDAALPKDSGNIDIRAIPLISGGTSQILSSFTEDKAFTSKLTDTAKAVDLNTNDWIGSPTGQTNQPLRAQWVEILEDPSQPRDDTFNPKTGRAKNGPVARYAFWIEDDSFRVNINTSGDTPRGSSTEGKGPSEVDLQSVMSTSGTEDFAAKLVALREALPDRKFFTASEINHVQDSTSDYKKLKYYITDTSKALNFSRGGVKRLNLNQVVADTKDADKIHDQIGRIIAAIGNTYAMPDLSGHKFKSDFGQRFFNNAQSKLNDKEKVPSTAFDTNIYYPDIYMEKLAANIRDYIDTDSQPTIIANANNVPLIDPRDERYSSGDFPVRKWRDKNHVTDATDIVDLFPEGSGTGPADTIAVGKEAVPALQEYAIRDHLISMSPATYSRATPIASFEMEESHYFEFVNPTSKTIKVSDLNTPFLMVTNQCRYDIGSEGSAPKIEEEGRTIQIPLDQFLDSSGNAFSEFPAGKAVVLTTDTSPEPSLAKDKSVTFWRISPEYAEKFKDKRHFKGTTSSHSGNMFRVRAMLGANGTSRAGGGSGGSDYSTQVMIGNEFGMLESFTALPIPGDLSVQCDPSTLAPYDSTKRYFFGGTLMGNLDTSKKERPRGVVSGDPRSLNEQLSIRRYGGDLIGVNRFLTSGLDPSGMTKTCTADFGTFLNPFLDLKLWPDAGSDEMSDSDTAYAHIADDKLTSIGQLGDVYDPIREPNTGIADLPFSRGGGRTLRIGQSEVYKNGAAVRGATYPGIYGVWDGEQNSLSRNRTAWRLADVFSASDEKASTQDATSGLININGVARDGGAALRAALYKLVFGNPSESDPSLKGKSLDIDSLVTAIQQRFPSLVNPSDTPKDNPFWERGELSEAKSSDTSPPIFSSGTKLAGTEMQLVLDRGREELVRRVMELITTKGCVYRAYCVGEAISIDRSGKLQVLARKNLKTTFEIAPKFKVALPADDVFDPDEELSGKGSPDSKRFRQPDSYQIKVLSMDTL